MLTLLEIKLRIQIQLLFCYESRISIQTEFSFILESPPYLFTELVDDDTDGPGHGVVGVGGHLRLTQLKYSKGQKTS